MAVTLRLQWCQSSDKYISDRWSRNTITANMIALLLVLSCLGATIQSTDVKQLFQDDPKMNKIREDCKKHTDVQPDVLKKIESGDIEDPDISSDDQATCYISCVLEKSELMKAGPPTFDNFKKLLSLSDSKGMVEIIKNCWSEGKDKSQKCEKHFAFFKCVVRGGEKTLKGPGDDTSEKGEEKSGGEKKGEDKSGEDKKGEEKKGEDKKGEDIQGDAKKSDAEKKDDKDGKSDDKQNGNSTAKSTKM